MSFRKYMCIKFYSLKNKKAFLINLSIIMVVKVKN